MRQGPGASIIVTCVAAVLMTAPANAHATDVDDYRRVLDAVHSRSWEKARTMADKSGDRVLANFVEWRRLSDAISSATFPEDVRFVESNPEWDGLTALMRRAEASMSPRVPARSIAEVVQLETDLRIDVERHLRRTDGQTP